MMNPILYRCLTPGAVAVLGSLLLSVLAWWRAGAVNDDGILYALAAQRFLDQGFAAAVQAYGWPFYSIALAGLSRLGPDLVSAGQLLNLASFAVLAWAFVALVRELHPGRPGLAWLAVPVILLLPELNDLRADLVRDNGFAASLLLSLLALLRYARSGSQRALLGWFAALGLAQAFRLEAPLYALAGLLALLALPARRGAAAGLLLALGGLALAGLAGLRHYLPGSRVGQLEAWWQFYSGEFVQHFTEASTRLHRAVLPDYARDYAPEALLAVLLTLVAAKLIKVWTPVHALALWLARRDLAPARGRALLWAYGLAATAAPLLFVLQNHFLTQRFVLPLALLLLLLAPAALAALGARLADRRLRRGAAALLLALFAAGSWRNLAGDGAELEAAGRWLAARPGRLWTNNTAVAFYAGRNSPERHVQTPWRAWREHLPGPREADWLALVLKKGELAEAEAWKTRLGGTEAARFEGRRSLVLVLARTVP